MYGNLYNEAVLFDQTAVLQILIHQYEVLLESKTKISENRVDVYKDDFALIIELWCIFITDK